MLELATIILVTLSFIVPVLLFWGILYIARKIFKKPNATLDWLWNSVVITIVCLLVGTSFIFYYLTDLGETIDASYWNIEHGIALFIEILGAGLTTSLLFTLSEARKAVMGDDEKALVMEIKSLREEITELKSQMPPPTSKRNKSLFGWLLGLSTILLGLPAIFLAIRKRQ